MSLEGGRAGREGEEGRGGEGGGRDDLSVIHILMAP